MWLWAFGCPMILALRRERGGFWGRWKWNESFSVEIFFDERIKRSDSQRLCSVEGKRINEMKLRKIIKSYCCNSHRIAFTPPATTTHRSNPRTLMKYVVNVTLIRRNYNSAIIYLSISNNKNSWKCEMNVKHSNIRAHNNHNSVEWNEYEWEWVARGFQACDCSTLFLLHRRCSLCAGSSRMFVVYNS